MFAEHILRGCFYAVAGFAAETDAEVDAVEIGGEDVFLAVLVFNAEGQDHFLDLTLVGFFVTVFHDETGQLLGDGTTTLDNGAGLEVGDHGPADTDRVDAVVFVEASVLDGNDSVGHVVRNFAGIDVDVVGVDHLINEDAVLINNIASYIKIRDIRVFQRRHATGCCQNDCPDGTDTDNDEEQQYQ